MDPNLYFVFSQKPDWVSRDDYHAWYVDHAQENIESPGFLNARLTRETRRSLVATVVGKSALQLGGRPRVPHNCGHG